MAIKDLAIAYNGSESSKAALRLAVQMSRKYDAFLTGLHANPPLQFDPQIRQWITEDTMASLREAEKEGIKAIEDQFRAELVELTYKGEADWIVSEGEPNRLFAKGARYYDILLLGQFNPSSGVKAQVRPEDIVLLSGKPIVVVPRDYQARPFNEYAVVAWDGSRPAARALTDAMQILETKNRLDVVTVAADEEAIDSSFDIVRHLKRHGINAKQVVLKDDQGGVGRTILGYCRQNDPDVLVMGAYNRARIREDLFGGTTKDILEEMVCPVFMAH